MQTPTKLQASSRLATTLMGTTVALVLSAVQLLWKVGTAMTAAAGNDEPLPQLHAPSKVIESRQRQAAKIRRAWRRMTRACPVRTQHGRYLATAAQGFAQVLCGPDGADRGAAAQHRHVRPRAHGEAPVPQDGPE